MCHIMVVKSKENEAMMKLAYKYYVVNSDNRIVCGFPTEEKAVSYASRNRYRGLSSNNLRNRGIDPLNVESWSVALFDATSCQVDKEETKE